MEIITQEVEEEEEEVSGGRQGVRRSVRRTTRTRWRRARTGGWRRTRSGRDGRPSGGGGGGGGRGNDHPAALPVPENQRRTLALASVPAEHVSHRELRQHFERTYRVNVQYACTTSEECVVDPATGLSTAYVKLRTHDDAVRVLDEIGKMSSGKSSTSTAGMEITIGEGNDMVGGIRVTGLHDSNYLGENKWVDRQQHPQQQQQHHHQGEDGGGGGRGGGGGQWNHQHE